MSAAAAAGLLNDAGSVTILAGAGVAGSHDEVMALAEALKAPIVHAFRGKEHIEWDNPYDVGMTGLLGFASGYRAMEKCDALLMLGTDFPYPQFLPDGEVREYFADGVQVIACPWHGWEYDLATGEALWNRARRLRAAKVEVDGGDLLVRL